MLVVHKAGLFFPTEKDLTVQEMRRSVKQKAAAADGSAAKKSGQQKEAR